MNAGSLQNSEMMAEPGTVTEQPFFIGASWRVEIDFNRLPRASNI